MTEDSPMKCILGPFGEKPLFNWVAEKRGCKLSAGDHISALRKESA